jgi:hypothetical protein
MVQNLAGHTMSSEGKTALVNLRVPPSLKAAAQKAAADDRRSLTSLIEKLLVEYLRGSQDPPRVRLPPEDDQPRAQVRAQSARSHDAQRGQASAEPPGCLAGRSTAGRRDGWNY